MKYIILSNNIITIISFIANLFFLLPFIYKAYKYFTKKRYIKKVLAYNNEPVQIYQSTFTYDTIEGYTYDFITYNSLECIDNILNIFNVINQKFSFVPQIDNAKNEICIGGFLSNKRVNAYFTKYFKNFKYYVDKKFESGYKEYPIDTQTIRYSKNRTGFQINKKFLETMINKIEYAFLIKLTPNDFETECRKTVHILFGGRSIGTIKATEYLMTQYKRIYKKYKNKHYFFAIEINLIDNSINYKKGIIDLTKEMFP